MDEQLHFGQDKNGRSLWHSNRDGTLWNGWHYSGIDPMELIAELESTIADLRAHYCPPQPPSASDERERFAEWFCADSHRRKYNTAHPVYLAANEAWQARAALAPSLGVNAAEQKPVAWVTSDGNMLVFNDMVDTAYAHQTGMTPLYAAPSPAASVDKWMAEAEALLDEYVFAFAQSTNGPTYARDITRAALLAHLKARP